MQTATPPKGYYRNLIPQFQSVRIAYTHTPIIGCTRINHEPIIDALRASQDAYAQFYIDGLVDGTLAAIVENGHSKEHWAPVELFFKS